MFPPLLFLPAKTCSLVKSTLGPPISLFLIFISSFHQHKVHNQKQIVNKSINTPIKIKKKYQTPHILSSIINLIRLSNCKATSHWIRTAINKKNEETLPDFSSSSILVTLQTNSETPQKQQQPKKPCPQGHFLQAATTILLSPALSIKQESCF